MKKLSKQQPIIFKRLRFPISNTLNFFLLLFCDKVLQVNSYQFHLYINNFYNWYQNAAKKIEKFFMNHQNVVVLGASPKEERYSNKAVRELLKHNHNVYPIHPRCVEIHGQTCYPKLDDITCQIDTLTLYIGKERSTPLIAQILTMKPNRIIMNPGAENDVLETEAKTHNIEVIRGCTLVMLNTGQF